MPGSKKPDPSVKDDELHETGRRGGTSPSYEDWTVDDLRERAAELDVEGRSGMTKSELVEALRHH
jgi:hypothetical protein